MLAGWTDAWIAACHTVPRPDETFRVRASPAERTRPTDTSHAPEPLAVVLHKDLLLRRVAQPNEMRLSCAAMLCSSQMQFYYDGRRQLQPLVRRPPQRFVTRKETGTVIRTRTG